jgi:hypothetical protein
MFKIDEVLIRSLAAKILVIYLIYKKEEFDKIIEYSEP